ncbi:MAG: hypothetical protein R2854_18295 [Caldilineaceae bacterium]
MALSVCTLAILILLPRYVPRIPAALVAVAFGIALAAVADVGRLGIELVAQHRDEAATLSVPDPSLLLGLWLPAGGIARYVVHRVDCGGPGLPQVRRTEAGRQPGTVCAGHGQFGRQLLRRTRRAVVLHERLSTPTPADEIAAMVTAGVVALTLLLLAPLISLMPQATLGSLVLVAAASKSRSANFRTLAQIRRTG